MYMCTHTYILSVCIYIYTYIHSVHIAIIYIYPKLNIQKTKIMASGPITSWEIDGETLETVSDLFWGAPKSLHMVTAAMKLKDAYSLEGKL